jgi:hypothetical protein
VLGALFASATHRPAAAAAMAMPMIDGLIADEVAPMAAAAARSRR